MIYSGHWKVNDMEKIADRIMNAMKATDTTYIELERRTGISKSALQRYATGETEKIPLDRLELIAGALDVSAAYLMGWDEKNPPAQVDERIWKNICTDSTKLILATWIAELDGDDLAKVSSVLAAILEKKSPKSPQN